MSTKPKNTCNNDNNKENNHTAMTSKLISFKIIPTSTQVKLQKVDSAKFVSTNQFFEIENDK